MTPARDVFVTGAAGFMGRRLCAALASRGHRVTGLVRPGREGQVPAGVRAVAGDPFARATFASFISAGSTVVPLVGVAHPNPARAEEFRTVDLASALEAFSAARDAGASQVVYVSVAQPAPVMAAYVNARREAEAALAASGLPATVLRPWYVLGPGRWWPALMMPIYWFLELIPAARAPARRLGLVTSEQMTAALVRAVEEPATGGVRVWDVPEIRTSRWKR